MKDQYQLFGGNPPHSNPTTSKDAAEAIKATTPTLRDRVLAFVREAAGGATDHEIQHALGLSGDTQRPRRWELVKLGLVVDSGKKRTANGRAQIVWIAREGA